MGGWVGDASDMRHGHFWADPIQPCASPGSDPRGVPAGKGSRGQVAQGGRRGQGGRAAADDDVCEPTDDEVALSVRAILERKPGPLTLYAPKLVILRS